MRQIKLFSYPLVIVAALALTACSTSHTNERIPPHQSNVKNTCTIAIPKDLNSAKIEDYYPMPKLEKQLSNKPVSIAPPGSLFIKNA